MKKSILTIVGIIVIVVIGVVAISQYRLTSTPNSVKLQLNGLENIAPAHYEGWAIFGDEKVSTGKFEVHSDGTLWNLQGRSQDTFTINRDLSAADKIAITIEAQGDTDKLPSGIILLIGSLNGNRADLSFPIDLGGVSGNYILATPTDDPVKNENSGVWFVRLPPPPTAGLSLPKLPDGWVYEGWALNSNTPITTGKFTSPEGSDKFNGYSGPVAGPPFPGEDFLVNAPSGLKFPINLADGKSKAVISVEPDLNENDPTGPGPFAIKPLVADIPLNAQDHFNYAMNQNLKSIPTGTATIF